MSLTAVVLLMAFGAFVTWKPKKVIALQIAFYRTINWKMEPISMEKEIRNTRAMGLAVLILGALSLIYIVAK